MKLLAYHGKQEIKDKYVARMKAHIEADELVRGIGFEGGKGCAVECTLNDYNYIEYETALGFPKWMAWLEDRLFEGMSLEKSKTFPLIFLEAIQPGMVLESIKKSFLIYILEQALTTFDNETFTGVKDSILWDITLHKTTFDAVVALSAAEATAWAAAGEARAEAIWAGGAAAVGEGACAAEAMEAAAMAVAREVETAAGAAGVAEAAAWAARAVAMKGAVATEGAVATAVGAAAMAAGAVARAVAWTGRITGAVAWTGGIAGVVTTAVWAAAWAADSGGERAKVAAYDKYADKLIELIKQCTIESE